MDTRSLCHHLNDDGDDGHNATNGYYYTTRAVKILRAPHFADDSFMPFLHNDTENNFQIGNYCRRQEVRAEEGRCGDQAAWRQPVARGRCSEDCEEPLICQLQVHRYDVDCGAFGSSDILIFQHFPFSRAQSAPCRLISEPPHDTVCFLHAPRTAHSAQSPGRAQSGGGGWSARTVYRVIYGDIWDMQSRHCPG